MSSSLLLFRLSSSSSSASPRILCSLHSPLLSVRKRLFHSSPSIMSDLSIKLTTPNGRTYDQPTGLFINNEFVAAKSGEKLASINPR